ncbi:hypothetical protein B0A48_09216 [Cryoendolithus antarcticus]|uniref:Uncharacterized protein n=1 Tax=Cryoendolithus antarcticus TaxID=1507870 RepID=A0A1V8T220_9PEZI|nr:hypothetical protein B0A48_09216 [Cryoendolithus antarcticus]
MANARDIHNGMALLSSYNFDKKLVNSSAEYIQHPSQRADPTEIFKELVGLIQSSLLSQFCDVDEAAVAAIAQETVADPTTNYEDDKAAVWKNIKNFKTKNRDRAKTPVWISSRMERVVAKRYMDVLHLVLYTTRERHHCEPGAFKSDRKAPLPRSHIQMFDEDPEIIECAAEKRGLSGQFMLLSLTTLLGATIPPSWPTVLAALSTSSSPLQGKRSPPARQYGVDDLSLIETNYCEKIKKDHLGNKSHIVGVHWQAGAKKWIVTILNERTQKVGSEDFDKGKHTRSLVGPCIADNLAKTNSISKIRRYCTFYRDLRDIVRRAPLKKRGRKLAAERSLFVNDD